MNDKRFKCTNISPNGMTGLFWLGKDQLSVYDVVRLLNELHEENKELKAENEAQFRSIMQLSEKINDCRRILDD